MMRINIKINVHKMKVGFRLLQDSSVQDFLDNYINSSEQIPGAPSGVKYNELLTLLGSTGLLALKGNLYGVDSSDYKTLKTKVGVPEIRHYATEEDVTNAKATTIGDLITDLNATGLYKIILDDEFITSNAITALDTSIKNVYNKTEVDNKLSTLSSDHTVFVRNMTDTTASIAPNTFYIWGEVTELTITLATPENANIYSEYMFQFTSGDTATTLSLPDNITWYLDNDTILANKTYQVSIVNNLAVLGEF